MKKFAFALIVAFPVSATPPSALQDRGGNEYKRREDPDQVPEWPDFQGGLVCLKQRLVMNEDGNPTYQDSRQNKATQLYHEAFCLEKNAAWLVARSAWKAQLRPGYASYAMGMKCSPHKRPALSTRSPMQVLRIMFLQMHPMAQPAQGSTSTPRALFCYSSSSSGSMRQAVSRPTAEGARRISLNTTMIRSAEVILQPRSVSFTSREAYSTKMEGASPAYAGPIVDR